MGQKKSPWDYQAESGGLEAGINTVGGGENISHIDVPVTIAISPTSPVSVTCTYTGTATGAEHAVPGVDYTPYNGGSRTITFQPGGPTTINVPLNIVNDNAPEGPETIILILSNPTGGAILGAASTFNYTISDPLVVSFGTGPTSGSEATSSINIPVTISSTQLTDPVTVTYTFSGTATGGMVAMPGVDYTPSFGGSGTITFEPGWETTKNIALIIVDDVDYEINETIILTLTFTTDGATLGSSNIFTYTIEDNESRRIYVDGDVNQSRDGFSWSNAKKTLNEALDLARVLPRSSSQKIEIWVASLANRNYLPTTISTERNESFTIPNYVSLYGGFPPHGGTWAQRKANPFDASRFETVLSGDILGNDDRAKGLLDVARGNDENSYHVVVVETGNTETVIDGFTVVGANNNNVAMPEGGAIFSTGAIMTVKNCYIVDNTATKLTPGSGKARGEGAGIFNTTYYPYAGTTTIENCVFENNLAGWGGAAITTGSGSSVDINKSVFRKNLSYTEGGAIYLGASPAIVTNCRFEGNRTQIDDDIGDVYNGGGAIFAYLTYVTMDNCVFEGNKAHQGPGGAIFSFGTEFTIKGCTFNGNAGVTSGGGIFSTGSLSRLVLKNCILWGNISDEQLGSLWEKELSCAPTDIVTYSCIKSDDNATPYGEGGNDLGNIAGWVSGVTCPHFIRCGYWMNNAEWITGDYHLGINSLCVDAADAGAASPVDIDGNSRVDNPLITNTGVENPPYVDMGAYEWIP